MGNEDILTRELYFLIYKFLEKSPCDETSKVLRQELEKKHLLPPQYEWTSGAAQPSSLEQVKSQNPHITADYLFRILTQSTQAISQLSPPPVSGVVSFLSSGRFSLLRSIAKKDSLIQQDGPLPLSSTDISSLSNHIHKAPILPSTRFTQHYPGNLVSSLISRQISGPKPIAHLWPTKCYDHYVKYRRLLGHLSSVFCVLFDRSGRYIFTGADDSLVKVWSASDGRLLTTLRGHINEITDLSVNYENTLLAAGSCDKMIRVWCLKTTAPVIILSGHNAQITSVKFCPLMRTDQRYLVSTSNDGCICFWQYDAQSNTFKERPIKFTERRRPGSQIVCSSFSAGGVFLAVGSTDNYLRVYHVTAPAGPTKILEIEQHSDHVDSIQFSNYSMRFVSGSRDGIAHIWNFERQNWKSIAINMTQRLPGMAEPSEEPTRKIRVSMVGWTCDDQYVITSLSDNSIKVWLSKNGRLKHILYGHEEEVFVIEAHPTDSRIFLSGGHDGAIIIWDVVNGTNLQTFFNAIDGQGHGAVFDCKFSPNGMMFASTDSHGHLSLFGLTHSDAYDKIPEQVFFHTDYRPVIRDANQYAIDEQTQIAPHLMPPPFLVDIDGNPYPPQFQRLVPGRENCSDSQLIPYVADSFMEERPPEPTANQEAQQRQTIDDMIQQLQRNVDQSFNQNNANSSNQAISNENNAQERDRNREPQRNGVNRRNGDVEGVRQPANFLSRGNQIRPIWYKKPVVPPLPTSEIVTIKSRQNDLASAEEHYYQIERKKRQDAQEVISIKLAAQQQRFTRSKRRIIQQRRGVRARGTRPGPGGINDYENADYESDEDDNDKDFSGLESSSSESDESDDSEWNQPTTSTCVSRKRKRNSNSSEEDERPESARPRRMETEENESRRTLRREQLNEIKRYRRRQFEQQYNSVQELPEAFRPPEWLTDCKPKRAPYFPQIGDEIVYFRQGHQNYIDHIRNTRLYNLNSSVKPYKLRGSDSDEIFAKIVHIRFDVKPPRLVTLKLVVMDPQAEEPLTNIHFSVRYHDVANVVDFIILKRHYDMSIARDWKENDEFRSVIDDKWWFGHIGSIRNTEPFSYFQCFEVTWANGDQEFLSPWDLEPISDGVLPENRTEGIPVTDEERISFNLINENEWPESVREEERQRLLNGLIRIMEFSHSEDFSVPVDLNQHPIYGMIIPYPMDLSTIKSRIENSFYRRVEAIKFDVNFIEMNAEQYNEPNSEIVKKAKIVTQLCIRFIDDDQCFDPLPIYLEVTAHYDDINSNASTSSSPANAVSTSPEMSRPLRKSARRARLIASDSDNDNANINAAAHPSTSSSNVNSSRRSNRRNSEEFEFKSWKQNCREFLDYIFDLQDSEPFRAPVDPIQYPNYSHVIDTPMDLTTVKEQLLADNYESPVEFCKDMRLIFMNSKTFNTNKKSRIYSMTIRLSTLFEEKMRMIMSDWKSTNKYLRNHKRGMVSSRRRPLPLSPMRDAKEKTISRTSSRNRGSSQNSSSSHDISHPSTSGFSSKNRSSQRQSKQSSSSKRVLSDSSPVEKYRLRQRNKRARETYKEESEESMNDIDDEDTRQSSRSRSLAYKLRKRPHFDEEEEFTEEEEEVIVDRTKSHKQDTEDENDDTEENDQTDIDQTEDDETKEDEEEEEEEECEEEDEEAHADSDATQMELDEDMENDKENTKGKRRPRRAAARKRVNYDENDDDESDGEVIKEKSVNVRKHSNKTTRNSFSQINESSRESMSSNRSSHGASSINADTDEDGSRPLRRSQRKIRPRRRYSSESDFEAPTRSSARNHGHSSMRDDCDNFDNRDLYSAVKTRHRTNGHSRGSSSRANYAEDDEEVYSPTSHYSTRRGGVFSNGRTTLLSR